MARLKIINVLVLPDFHLRFWLSDGRTFVQDFREEVAHPRGVMDAPLGDQAFFAQARYDPELETVVWPNGYDMDPCRLIEEARFD
jgi:hypothetical protein